VNAESGLRGERILVTGATGAVATPIVRALASENAVTAMARFRDPASAKAFTDLGVEALACDLQGDGWDAVPDAFDYVLHFAVDRGVDGSFDAEFRASGEATMLLMQRCRSAKAFLQCSSNAVYHPNGGRPVAETAPLGDAHRDQYLTYSIGRMAGEIAARAGARAFGVPTVVARLNVPYGSVWGWPARHLRQLLAGETLLVHPTDGIFSPIHEDDIVRSLAPLLAAATVPATVVNWAGDEAVAMQDWCRLLARLIDVEPKFEVTAATFTGANADVTRRRSITGPTGVSIDEGLRRMVADHQAATTSGPAG
jgi:nucleoside-diphosphate-sugar epimerase